MKWPTVAKRRAALLRVAKEGVRLLGSLLVVVGAASSGALGELIRLCGSN